MYLRVGFSIAKARMSSMAGDRHPISTAAVRAFWAQMTGPVHPQDAPVFAATPAHTFNLDFPPPAFVGSLDAPVVILMANGGFHSERTPREFIRPGAAGEYLAYLRSEAAELPRDLSRYYRSRSLGLWLEGGVAVMVNAVAYRSPKLSKEPANRALAERLPSLAVHRRWVREAVLPEAQEGRRFLIVHRNGMWQLDRDAASEAVVFSRNPLSSVPAGSTVERARDWLEKRSDSGAVDDVLLR